jgi:4-hydroxy-tetrahydrodipicolinate synthase
MVIAALPTMFGDDLEIDVVAARQLAQSVSPHVSGIFVCGTNAEFPALTFAERAQLSELFVDELGADRVVVHVGDVTTWGALDLAASAVAVGARHLAAITPMIFPVDDDAIVEHFRSLRRVTPGMLFAYDFPEISQNALSLPAAERLRGIVDGIKVSGRSTAHVAAFAEMGLRVLSGEDRQPSAVLAAGGVGVVSGTASAIPAAYAPIVAGRFADQSTLTAAVDRIGGSIPRIKELIAAEGIGRPWMRVGNSTPARRTTPAHPAGVA